MKNLIAGLRLALFLPVQPQQFRSSLGQFWLICLLGAVAGCAITFGFVTPPRLFQASALSTEAFNILCMLLGAFCVARLFQDNHLQWDLPIVLFNGLFWAYLIVGSAFLGGLTTIYDSFPQLYRLLYDLILVWYGLILVRGISLLTPVAPIKRLCAAALMITMVLAPQFLINLPEYWETDYYALYQGQEDEADQGSDEPDLDAEAILSRQWPLVEAQTATLQPSAAGTTDLFFVGFAGDGQQDVFMKEVNFSRDLFDNRFGTRGHSLSLINNPETAEFEPLATGTNLELALKRLNPLIQSDEDILFLFLTSHGGKEHYLSVQLPPLPLNDLPALALADILNKSQFRWKVILISACYSGGFIEPLKNEDSLIITAARPDRTSFGCSDDAEFTYFGRAYFVDALAHTNDFITAFDIAKNEVQTWEEKEKFTPSEPQIFVGSAIREKLRQWRGQLTPAMPADSLSASNTSNQHDGSPKLSAEN